MIGIVLTGPWDTDSEMEVWRLEFCWEMPSETTPVQEWKWQEDIKGEIQLKCRRHSSLSCTHRRLWSWEGLSEWRLSLCGPALTSFWMWSVPWENASLWTRATPGRGLSCDPSPVSFQTTEEMSVSILKQDPGSIAYHPLQWSSAVY